MRRVFPAAAASPLQAQHLVRIQPSSHVSLAKKSKSVQMHACHQADASAAHVHEEALSEEPLPSAARIASCAMTLPAQ